jgi:SAM-dependent methyltransferase
MDDATRRALGELNAAFYSDHAEEFSATRSRPWPGWERVALRLVDAAAHVPRPSVLDVGCGNGRLLRFLAETLGRPFDSVGLDASRELLALAATQVETGVRLVQHDFVTAPAGLVLPPAAGRGHQLVALFGVLHHVPSRERRRALVEAAAECTAPGGMLALCLWQFAQRERFADHIVAWDDVPELAIDRSQLEAGDHLLRWGQAAVRYCHFVDAVEAEELADLPGLSVVERYDADGRSGDLNRYILLVRGG